MKSRIEQFLLFRHLAQANSGETGTNAGPGCRNHRGVVVVVVVGEEASARRPETGSFSIIVGGSWQAKVRSSI